MHRLALLSAAVVAMPVGLAAQETRQLDAHMHGESALNIAIEGNAVAMELEAPAMDIVGFEHEPSTDEHRAQIEAAIKSLSAPLDVFVFPEGAGCAVSNASVEHVFGEVQALLTLVALGHESPGAGVRLVWVVRSI